MSDLKPCPFCGGENVKTSYKDTFSGDFRRGVYCADCCGGIYPYYDTEAEAIAAWNSRAERTCKQEERGWGTEGDHARVWLTCGHDCMVPTVQDLPNYCPNCGARVVE